MIEFTETNRHQLAGQVQQNCHISDARYARDYSMCIYLLKMREFFRWERGYGFSDALPKDELGEWLTQRESDWDSLEDVEFSALSLDVSSYDPFDSAAINKALKRQGLVYSGGIGVFAKPSFFLAKRDDELEIEGYPVLVAGTEYARDINAQPAMSDGSTVFVRREALRRMLWEKLEEWRWQRRDNVMAKALSFYPFEAAPEEALESMTTHEIAAVLFHEVGELLAGEQLGHDWRELVTSASRSRLELVARAAKDHLADTLVTLPRLLERDAVASLHFYFANLTGMRREIYPLLVHAYRKWQESGSIKPVVQAVETGRHYWQEQTGVLMEMYRKYGVDGLAEIEKKTEGMRC